MWEVRDTILCAGHQGHMITGDDNAEEVYWKANAHRGRLATRRRAMCYAACRWCFWILKLWSEMPWSVSRESCFIKTPNACWIYIALQVLLNLQTSASTTAQISYRVYWISISDIISSCIHYEEFTFLSSSHHLIISSSHHLIIPSSHHLIIPSSNHPSSHHPIIPSSQLGSWILDLGPGLIWALDVTFCPTAGFHFMASAHTPSCPDARIGVSLW
jgi:hypothetical protein